MTQNVADWTSTAETVGTLGHFDLLVNSAGVGFMTPFFDQELQDVDR